MRTGLGLSGYAIPTFPMAGAGMILVGAGGQNVDILYP